MSIEKSDIYLASLDPTIGKEIAKTRPVLVISNNQNNEFARTVTALPITSQNTRKLYPFEVYLSKGTGNLPKNSKVKANQIRTIDKSRLLKFIGKIDENV